MFVATTISPSKICGKLSATFCGLIINKLQSSKVVVSIIQDPFSVNFVVEGDVGLG
jgi:hypothetical protein